MQKRHALLSRKRLTTLFFWYIMGKESQMSKGERNMIYEKIPLDPQDEKVYLEVYAPEKMPGFVRDALLVIPGGGYEMICDDREGEPIALDFVQKGMASFVLHYSVGEGAKFPRPLIEASMAMKYIKDNASRYNISPDRVFATGFSAGGHLAASLGILWHRKEIYAAVDMPEGYNKPKGILPIYPVVSVNVDTHMSSFRHLAGNPNPAKEELLEYSLDMHVDEKSAPAFICHSATDETVSVQNALCLAWAYEKASMPFELHIFKEANHGMALANEITGYGDPTWVNASNAKWTELARLWMKGIQ